LKDTKNDLIEEQNIDFGKTSLFGNVLNLVETLQNTNSIEMLLARSEDTKNDPVEE